mmetsp:Transcript_68319/g.142811  ORF Transcript_68319/g.142811 Transcript_68319/m.142811 type:complete len:243 (+) Transcript_68319:42-770(+)
MANERTFKVHVASRKTVVDLPDTNRPVSGTSQDYSRSCIRPQCRDTVCVAFQTAKVHFVQGRVLDHATCPESQSSVDASCDGKHPVLRVGCLQRSCCAPQTGDWQAQRLNSLTEASLAQMCAGSHTRCTSTGRSAASRHSDTTHRAAGDTATRLRGPRRHHGGDFKSIIWFFEACPIDEAPIQELTVSGETGRLCTTDEVTDPEIEGRPANILKMAIEVQGTCQLAAQAPRIVQAQQAGSCA